MAQVLKISENVTRTTFMMRNSQMVVAFMAEMAEIRLYAPWNDGWGITSSRNDHE